MSKIKAIRAPKWRLTTPRTKNNDFLTISRTLEPTDILIGAGTVQSM